MAAPPCFAWMAMKWATLDCMASSHEMRCQPGSSPFGFVRFMG